MGLTWEEKWQKIEALGLDLQVYADHSPVVFWVSTAAEVAGDGILRGIISNTFPTLQQAVENLFEKYTTLPEGFYLRFTDYGDGTAEARDMCVRWNADQNSWMRVLRTVDKTLFGRYN